MKWDDRATQYLPGFQLYDPYATRELTVRDLLTHRSGLTAAATDVVRPDVTRDSILRRVRYLKPTWSFRVPLRLSEPHVPRGRPDRRARLLGSSWDDVIRERIFVPLGMTASNTSVTLLDRLPDVATPHAEIDDTVRRSPTSISTTSARPARSTPTSPTWRSGCASSSRAARCRGKPLISAAAFEETHTPQTDRPARGLLEARRRRTRTC